MGIFLRQATALLRAINDPYFQQGLAQYFNIAPNGMVGLKSVCWLFCWAVARGRRYAATAQQVRKVWAQIFDFPLAAFSVSRFLPFARRHRY